MSLSIPNYLLALTLLPPSLLIIRCFGTHILKSNTFLMQCSLWFTSVFISVGYEFGIVLLHVFAINLILKSFLLLNRVNYWEI